MASPPRIDSSRLPGDAAVMAERFLAISTHPALLARQMEQLTAIDGELREIIALCLRQQSGRDGADAASADDLDAQAEAGVMRYVGVEWSRRIRDGAEPQPPDGRRSAPPSARHCAGSADRRTARRLRPPASGSSQLAAHDRVAGVRRVAVEGLRRHVDHGELVEVDAVGHDEAAGRPFEHSEAHQT